MEAADLLFSLPVDLLDDILMRLDLRDAVRTSALSTHWRRRWESLPALALCFPDGPRPPRVVDSVLILCPGAGVSRFAFHVDAASASHVDHWLVALSRRVVESISIRQSLLSDQRAFSLHSSVFSCARLVSLDLEYCEVPLLPVGFTGFPLLEELYLSNVDFGEDQLQDIIRGSPLLRVLFLQDVDSLECVIEAPNLHSLTLGSEDRVDWRFGELPCLQVAKILMSYYLQYKHDFGGFLTGIAQVRELTFFLPFEEVTIDKLPFTFYNLKILELRTHFTDMSPILLMFCLLRSSPNLEKLKIEIEEPGTVVNRGFLKAQWTDGMCANLQIVEIISARWWLPISFMKLILSKASLLRTLSMDMCPGSQDDRLNRLLKCRRASAQAQVLFEVQLKGISEASCRT